jgi:predicted ATPase
VAQLDMAVGRLMATGHRVWVWYLRALRAEGMALCGDLEGACALIDESVARMEQGRDRSHYAEVLRLKGWLLTLQEKRDEAETTLRAAIDVAQQAKSWELRAATTLAHLLAERGECASAHALLAPVYAWFTEGFNTRDLRGAKRLLDALQG